MGRQPLKETEQEVFEAIKAHIETYGFAPSRREIVAVAERVSSLSVANYNLKNLAEKGYIILHPDTARGIVLAKEFLDVVDRPDIATIKAQYLQMANGRYVDSVFKTEIKLVLELIAYIYHLEAAR